MSNSTPNNAGPSDDISVLPNILLPIFKNPYRAFGIDSATVTDKNIGDFTPTLRDGLRKACISESHYFAGFTKPKLTSYQILVAYHIIRGTLPKNNAIALKEALEVSPHILKFNVNDILPVLKPLYGGKDGLCSRDYRAAKMLGIECKGITSSPSLTSYGIRYSFQVHYCMRLKTVELEYDSILAFHNKLKAELLIVPQFPELDVVNTVFNKSLDHGIKVAEYFMKIHGITADKGKFYPRLLRLLEIDFEAVQSEEEGAIMKILDTQILPPRTVYHIIDEKWLVKWRSFAMGRGPRRYLPPGPITNGQILKDSKKQNEKKSLERAVHYRSVNFNVWAFLSLVHGGGPVIARKEEDIYSPKGMSYLQAVVVVQCAFRLYLAKKSKKRLQMIQLSRSTAGRAVIAQITKEELNKNIEEKIRQSYNERTTDKVSKAINFTQALWRKKKNLVPVENLKKIQKDHEVFARAHNTASKFDTAADEVVVLDTVPIVHIGSTNSYVATITEEVGHIPFKTQRLPGSEIALVSETSNQDFANGSKILAINGYPTSSLTYEQIKAKLSQPVWPITLELERPVKDEQVPTLDTIMSARDKVIQYNAFKIMLSAGLNMIKHNSNNRGSHFTTIRITDTEFFYRSRFDPRKKENDQWQKISLFDLKFVLGPNIKDPVAGNHESERVDARRSRKLNPCYCIEIVANDREIILELADDDVLDRLKYNEEDKYRPALSEEEQEAKRKSSLIVARQNATAKIQNVVDYKIPNDTVYKIKKVFLLVEHMKSLANEVKSSQIYVDSDGVAIRRNTAKTSLRKLN